MGCGANIQGSIMSLSAPINLIVNLQPL